MSNGYKCLIYMNFHRSEIFNHWGYQVPLNLHMLVCFNEWWLQDHVTFLKDHEVYMLTTKMNVRSIMIIIERVTNGCFYMVLYYTMCVCESIYRSDQGKTSKWFGIYRQDIFVLAEPAEPSQGFRPCIPRAPPGLTEHMFCHKFQTNPSHIKLITTHMHGL